jgi:dipeptidyl aminopeptidase/acylaminoacyl peptidase
VDWLEERPEVDTARIGMTGISLGGYYAPRAVAFEPRFASGAVRGQTTIGPKCSKSG